MVSFRAHETQAIRMCVGLAVIAVCATPVPGAAAATPGRLAFGRPTAVSVSAANETAEVRFAGTAGQRVSLLGTNGLTGQLLGCDINVSILKPDATVLAPPTCMEQTGFIDVRTLPSTGTYTILVDPAGAATGGVTLTLHEVPADYSASIAAGGPPVTATMSTPGQNAALTFSGTPGQRIFLKGTNGMTGHLLACDVNVRILQPDGAALAPDACMENSGFIGALTLATGGTYTIVVDPLSHAAGNITLTLYTVPDDTTGVVTIGGPAVTVTLSTPGQIGTRTFSGTAGQQVTVRMTANTFGWVAVRLKKPDGSVLATLRGFSSFGLPPQTLPTTGTYTIEVDPGAAGSITLAATSL